MIRIVHTLGGCGGTLLSRCLGVLPGVALLSEINPASVKLFPHFDPLYQDRNWLHLLDPVDAERFSKLDLSTTENFRDLMRVFHRCATAAGRHLLLRDYSYVDFIGIPYIPHAPQRLTLYDALPPAVPTAAIAFVRHPFDQWLSLCKHEHVRAILTASRFCTAYAAFLQNLGNTPIYKYEDFTHAPEAELRSICRDLDLPFDPSFLERFHDFNAVTGDFARHGDNSISPPQKSDLPQPLIAEFHSTKNYWFILEAAGYPDLPTIT